MTLHREGYPTLIFVGSILLILNLLLKPFKLLWVSIPLSVVIFGFFAQFFRNPTRTTPPITDEIIAPADGTIVAIETVMESEYFNAECLKISIYMSALNVHVNRNPINGTVKYTKYHPGKYLVAYHPKSSELNERSTIVIADANGREVLVRQIAGLLARRIVTYSTKDQAVKAGSELGFIKFGSRCDVFLSPEATPLVALDQPVRGGETLIARF